MRLRNIEDFYPLSPLQQGMLFHSLYAPDSGEYFEQLSCTLRGDFDSLAFERAWQYVVDRHPSLRSAFIWEGPKEPVQVVYREAKLPFVQHDLRGLTAAEQRERIDAFVRADRAQGFELTKVPLMRLALLRTADDSSYLLWSHHHLLIDGWCLSLILKEVFACYDAFCLGQAIQLERPRPYRDYIAWLQRQDLAKAEAFWRATLRGFTTPTPLLPERVTASPPSEDAYGECSIALSESTTAALQSLARRHQLTLNTLVQGAWALLLGRYSGERDVVFGTVVAGRPPDLRGVETMVGNFINTLPVRVQLTSAALLPWLEQLQAQQIEMRQYEYSSLVAIQGWSDVPRGLPLFASLVIFENYPLDASLGARDRSPAISDIDGVERQNYPLALFVGPGQTLALRMLYNAGRFDSASITRMLRHLRTVLAGMATNAQQPIATLPLLTVAEQHQALHEWNGPAARLHRSCIHERYAVQAARTPDAIALVYDFRDKETSRQADKQTAGRTTNDGLVFSLQPSAFSLQMTYRELDRRANQLAQHLRRLGVGPEARVGLYLERSLELLVAILGILKAGAAYVPLNPAYPPDRLAFILNDTQVALLITDQSIDDLRLTIDDLRASDTPIVNRKSKIVNVVADWPRIAAEDDTPPHCAVTAANLAYVIYTSGSTGRPKGVQIAHRSVISLLEAARPVFQFRDDDVWTVVHSYAFDLSVWEIWCPLLHGGRLVVVPLELAQTPSALYELLCRQQVSVLNQTPSAIRQLLAVGDAAGVGGARLRLLMCGGEALPRELALQLLRWQAPLWNFYGPTEATVWAAIHPVSERSAATAMAPVGRPLANTQIYLLDARWQLVPIGIVGEVFIGGDGLSRGYFARPDLTAERFIPNPFASGGDKETRRQGDKETRSAAEEILQSAICNLQSAIGTRLYKTGDLARYLPDGSIEFVARVDHQVKLRGFRVELGEIEATLARHPAVRESVVVTREDVPGNVRLVAYVVPAETLNDERRTINGPEWSSSAFSVQRSALAGGLRAFLHTHLPDYMVPAAFVLLDALPLTTNGKIDRRALPAPDLTASARAGVFIAPRTAVEKALAAIWAELFGLEQVSIDDNFFALGGHSLLAIQLFARLREAFQVALPLRRLFELPTLAGLAGTIVRQQGEQAEAEYAVAVAPLPAIVPAPDQQYLPFPLTDIQQAYWVGRSAAFELGNVAAHLYAEVESTGLDLARFELALQRLIDRHAMLRAIILPDGQQQILEHVPAYRVDLLELRGQPPAAVEAQLAAVRQRMSHQVLPSDQWPLFQVRASQLDDQRIRLHVSCDLLIADAWSLRILLAELAQFYSDPTLVLAPLELSFRDYVVGELALHNTPQYQHAHTYWHRRLPELPPAPELPLAKSPAAVIDARFVRRGAQLAPETWARLKAQATQAGLTPSGLLLAAFADVLTVWSKSPRFTINLTLFNRLPLHAQVNAIVGDFTSVTLLAVDNTAQEPFTLRARRLQQQLWEDLDHRYVSGIRVLRELARLRGGPQHTAMPVVFTSTLSLPVTDQDSEAALAQEQAIYSISQTPQVWLDHQVSERGGALVFNWDAVEELFPSGLLDDMFVAYCTLLARLADQPTSWQATTRQLTPLAQLDQRAAINATAAPISDELLQTLFVAQARRRPLHPAVIATTQTLTYEALDRRANQLGRWLRQLGAQPNALVAVVMEKGWEQIVAVMGVLQAGAAYLPIDPELPQQRIWYLLEHGAATLVLTQSRLAERLDWPAHIQRLCIDDAELRERDDRPLPALQQPEDLAYVIYTSGSTGLPKGVMIDHRGAVNTILDINQRFAVGPADRVLALSSLSFDLSVYDIFGVLAAGGTLVVPDATARRDPAHWAMLIAREGVTLWNSVPALIELLVDALPRAEELRSLRLVLLSGDWIPLALPDRIKALSEDVQVISLGGATEASIWSILHPITAVQPTWTSIPYGLPMRNQQFHVLDQWLEPCPVWVAGQLFIGGVGLALGYWRDEAKTQASFITHPLSGERLYCTGDLGRYLPDGTIEFLGREDFQVKLQGYRIELGEIEAALRAHPAVQTAVVVALGEARGHKRLVAYVVPAETLNDERRTMNGPEWSSSSFSVQRSALAGELRTFLAARLPAYMLPAAFVLLDALPLNANGKLDRAALPSPDLPRLAQEERFVMPRSAIEQALADIWVEVLGLERIGVHDNFFDLGGDSILGIQITARANRAGLQLTPKQIFQSQTIAELSSEVAASARHAPQTNQARVNGPAPLSPIQHWFFEQDFADAHHWNQALLLESRMPLEPTLLRQALRHLLHQHDALRLRFERHADGWRQMHAERGTQLPFTQIDLSALAEAEQSAALTTIATALQASLDLSAGPLLRVALFDLSSGRASRLLLIGHHLVVDAVSWRSLLDDLWMIYEQLQQRVPVRLPTKTSSFKEWAEGLVAHAQSDAVVQELAYWSDPARMRAARLPLDYPAAITANTVASVRSVSVALDPIATQSLLHEVPQVYQTQINDLLLTALLYAFTPWSGGRSLLVELTGHGRAAIFGEVDLTRTIGWFSTLTPVLLELPADGQPGAALKAVKEQLRRVPNNGIGYGLLRYLNQDARIGAQLRALPPAELRFNYLGRLDAALPDAFPLTLAREASGPARSPRGHRSYLLEIDSSIVGGQLQLNWTYSTNLHDDATIARLAQQFIEALRMLIAHCLSSDAGGYTPSDFPEAELSQEELDALLEEL